MPHPIRPDPSSRFALRAMTAPKIARDTGSGGGALRGAGDIVDERAERFMQVSCACGWSKKSCVSASSEKRGAASPTCR